MWDVRMPDPNSAKDLFPIQLMSVLKGNLELGGDTEFPDFSRQKSCGKMKQKHPRAHRAL